MLLVHLVQAKSTFLRCLNRLEEISGGEVVINGQDITDKKININKVRQEVGMVFQHFNLFPHKTVLENITMGPIKIRATEKAAAEKLAFELLDKVGLREKANSYPGELSRGTKTTGCHCKGTGHESKNYAI